MKSVEDAEDRETRKKKDDYLTFSPLTVVVFVVICCIMIVLLYFFYRWLGKKLDFMCAALSIYLCISSQEAEASLGYIVISRSA
jgi:signal peptide peptidase-like protein 2A